VATVRVTALYRCSTNDCCASIADDDHCLRRALVFATNTAAVFDPGKR
jgi:hypothetical protein